MDYNKIEHAVLKKAMDVFKESVSMTDIGKIIRDEGKAEITYLFFM